MIASDICPSGFDRGESAAAIVATDTAAELNNTSESPAAAAADTATTAATVGTAIAPAPATADSAAAQQRFAQHSLLACPCCDALSAAAIAAEAQRVRRAVAKEQRSATHAAR